MTRQERIRQLKQIIVRTREAIGAQRLCLAVMLNNPTAYAPAILTIQLDMFSRGITAGRLMIEKTEQELKEM